MINKWALFGNFLPLVGNEVVSNTGTLKLGIFKTNKKKVKEISSQESSEMSLLGKELETLKMLVPSSFL